MGIIKIDIEQLQELSGQYPVLDVRSPGEYTHAHIPGAYSLPLFTDEERKIIGTAYKQQSREKAIKIGLDFFGVKMRPMVEEAEKLVQEHFSSLNHQSSTYNTVIVHCWRGGMRSSAVAWLLNFYGFQVYLLDGGYKAFRNWVLQQFEPQYRFSIVGGYTGSGKTEILKCMQQNGHPVIDLEALAGHKGSAFGALGLPPQPTQEMFENRLAISLHTNKDNVFWLEDESQRIGKLNIPHSFWRLMRTRPVYFIEIPFAKRLEHILAVYGSIEKEQLVNAILRIRKRLGPNETKTAINFLIEDSTRDSFTILLNYYDKTYQKALENRENLASLLNKIDSLDVDAVSNTEKLIACAAVHS